MLSADLLLLTQELNSLAEVFDRKTITGAASKVWFDTLKEFPAERVLGILIGWPKTHIKFPAPAEVWKICNESATNQREAKALAEAKQNAGNFTPGVSGAQAQKFIEEIRKILRRPQWTPAEHWENNLKRFKPGQIGYEYAKDVLRLKAEALGREPGED